MAVLLSRGPVGGPTGMSDASVPGRRRLGEAVGKRLELASGPAQADLAIADDGDPGRVVAAIFESFEGDHQDLIRVLVTDIAGDSAHSQSIFCLGWPGLGEERPQRAVLDLAQRRARQLARPNPVFGSPGSRQCR